MTVEIRKWDVVLLAYPFTDASASKVRPALVISPNSENARLDDGVFVAITSNVSRRSGHDIVISQDHPEFEETGLLKSSAVRVNKIWTLRKSLARRRLGRLGPGLRHEVTEALAIFLELPR